LIDVSKGHTDNDKLLSYLEMMRESAKKIDDLVNDIHVKSTTNRN
jgi:methyl-accepting chemotaxis protein